MSDRAFIGQVRYGAEHLIDKTANLFRYMTTKRSEYAHEQEVRAFLWIPDPHAGINRHIDAENRVHPLPLTPPPANVPKGQRRKVDLDAFVTGIVASPWASLSTLDEITQMVRNKSSKIPVQESELSRYAALLP
jgi:hypothetical protein